MAAPHSAQLNPEPADPERRQEQNLPAKSFADALQQDPPINGVNGNKEVNGTNGSSAVNELEKNGDGKHTASVLRIVDTGAPATKTKEETRPEYDRQESNHEYSGAGLDEAPRTPPRGPRHRKTPSRSNLASKEKPTSEEMPTTTNGVKSADTKVKKEVVFENLQGEKNGSKLMSVKSADYEKQVRENKKQAPKPAKEEKLATGREAGRRWGTSAIRFAPLNVPLQRRLQTLVVLWHTLCIALLTSIFCFLCAIPLFWPLLIPYMVYCMSSKASTNGTLSHRSEFLRSLPIWSLFSSYFPARLHRSQELPPTRKYIFGYHPHGIISMGAFAAFGTESLGFGQLFPGIKNTLLTLDSNFRIPIYRDYALAMGLGSVSKESCENLLSKGGPNNEGMGRAITIVVGGAAESLDAKPYSLRLVLKRRKGFVKIAIRTGADLVPVLAFGENDIYEQFQPDAHPYIHNFQLVLKKVLGFTIPLFHARGIFNYDVGLMPYRKPINIVVGRPITVVRNEKPSQEEIDRVHEMYVKELERVWDTWKDDFAKNRQEELEFVE